MGCTMSKKELLAGLTTSSRGGGGPPKNDVVSLCAQRKRLLKSAVGRRKSFADAHCKYIRSLHSVSSAVSLFVSTFSPLPLTPELRLPSSSSLANTNNKITYEKREDSVGVNYSSGTWSVNSGSSDVEIGDNDEDREGEENEGQVCEFFYGDNNNNNNDRPRPPTPPPMPSPQRGFGWDFFSLLDHDPTTIFDVNVNAVDEGCDRSETKLKRKTVTSGKKGNGGDVGSDEKNEDVMKKGNNSLELITALKDLEKHFTRACESGLDVSRMLEVNTTHHLLPTVMEHQTEENQSTYVATPLTPVWLRSPSSQSSSCKSLISSSSFKTSTSSSAWTDCKSDMFDGCGIMESGSHSFTLGRLYAWEKKLYEEVKAGEQARKSYQQKCSSLRKQKQQHGSRNTSNYDSKSSTTDHTELAELYNKILVVSKSSETISNQINKMRDEELQPQLLELMHGLLRTWKAMLESHKTQNKIISKVNSFTSSDDDLTDSQRKATLHLESELKNWLTSFTDYISAQRSYVKCLYSYLSKLIDPTTTDNYHHNLQPKQEFSSSPLIQTITHNCSNGPALLLACQRWYDSVERLPDKPVKFSMKRLVNDLHETWVQMGEEQDMKKRVENLAREVEKRTTASVLSKEVNSIKSGGIVMIPKSARGWISGMNIVKHHHRGEDLSIAVEVMREKLELEKERHKMSLERTKAVTLNVFTIGFSSVFESMVEFSRESVKLYDELVGFCDENGNQ